jgi:hypothetical protein
MSINDSLRYHYNIFNLRLALVAALIGLSAVVIAKNVWSLRSKSSATRRNAYWRLFGIDLGRN